MAARLIFSVQLLPINHIRNTIILLGHGMCCYLAFYAEIRRIRKRYLQVSLKALIVYCIGQSHRLLEGDIANKSHWTSVR